MYKLFNCTHRHYRAQAHIHFLTRNLIDIHIHINYTYTGNNPWT